jgi:hypothetical protein
MTPLEDLRLIVKTGSVAGGWTEKQVRQFQERCASFLGEHGEQILDLHAAALTAANCVAHHIDTEGGGWIVSQDLHTALSALREALREEHQ